jgi:hypothetical protein
MTYEIKNDAIESTLRKLATGLATDIPDGWGFTLFIVEFGEKGSTFYISNTNRQDMIKAMQEFIDKNKQHFNES